MRSGEKWRCANCGRRESSPIATACPECNRIGERYPLKDRVRVV